MAWLNPSIAQKLILVGEIHEVDPARSNYGDGLFLLENSGCGKVGHMPLAPSDIDGNKVVPPTGWLVNPHISIKYIRILAPYFWVNR